jgi:hypothetical protein
MKDRWPILYPHHFNGLGNKRLPTILEWRLLQQEFEESLKVEATPSVQPAQPVTMDDESELPLNYKEKGYTRERIPDEFRHPQPQLVEAQPPEPMPDEPATEPAEAVETTTVSSQPAEPQSVEPKPEPAQPVELKIEAPEPFRFQLAEHHRPAAPIRDMTDEAIQALIGERLRGKIGRLRAAS